MLAPFVLAVLMLCLVAGVMTDILSAARAYVGGESMYSKGQKEAVYHLNRYVASGAEADFRRYQAAIALPLGDAIARRELERPEPDLAVVRAGFAQGGNHPQDINAMVRLYRYFGRYPPMSRAIAIWADGDAAVAELDAIAGEVHRRVGAGERGTPALIALADRMAATNDRLTELEGRFSATLGAASRTMRQAVLIATGAAGAALALAGVLLTSTLLRRQADAERATRESNERWEMAAAAAQIGVLDWDVAHGRIGLDARAAQLCGLGAGAAVHVAYRELIAQVHPDDRERLASQLEQAARYTIPLETRCRLAVPPASPKVIELNVRRAGAEQRVVGILWDVTADVQRDRLLLDKEAAERASAAKTMFLSRVSHELRTPLNAVLGFAQLLVADPQSRLDDRQLERVRHIRQAGTHLLALVDDVLDLVSIEADEDKLEAHPVELDAVLRDIELWIEPQARAAGIATHWAATRARVRGDERRLRQVLSNLLSNAVKYNRAGGSVTVRLVEQSDLRWTVLSVRDTGRGMSAQQLEQLFQPFNRLGAERDNIPGTGIGLNIARRLVERMGGRLEVRSTPGAGTDFQVWLASDADDAAADALPTAPGALGEPPGRAPRGRIDVLYVEDNPVNVLLVEHALQTRAGVVLEVAGTGSDGVTAALRLRPALMLIDMELPDIDGFEVLRRVRALPELDDTLCIALSANAMPDYIARARSAGFDDYWTKPIDFRRFVAAFDALEPALRQTRGNVLRAAAPRSHCRRARRGLQLERRQFRDARNARSTP